MHMAQKRTYVLYSLSLHNFGRHFLHLVAWKLPDRNTVSVCYVRLFSLLGDVSGHCLVTSPWTLSETSANQYRHTIGHIVHGLKQDVLDCQNVHGISRYTRKCNFVYAHKKRSIFLALIFTKLTNTQQHYVQASYTEFHPNRTVYLECMDTHSFVPASKGCNRTLLVTFFFVN